ncbi:type VII secretion integral membrane protein EccD [Mycobacterium simiae]|uniref:Type VII secretion integral membrane protein EccD n=1 Tax=Mycobacterium simiae TaxID=1784 RepID=A0A5B1BJT6_MYCSI|nr:type VII secretion integral membrane protein EccD [Mycobacterium simiae]KAA1248362.1 type VII secretion integral membrane protein EccD [Mycobacterium simiae]
MSAADPALRRVTVHADSAVVDLSLPAAVPIATLIPAIVDIVGGHIPARYRLFTVGREVLVSSTTLAQSGIRDGAVLVLCQSCPKPPNHRFDDVAEAVSTTLTAATRPWPRRATRHTGALAACGFTGVGAVLLVRNAFGTNAHVGGAAVVAAAAAAIALVVAGIAQRALRDPIAALALSVIATMFAGVTGLLAVSGAPGLPHLMLATMAAAITAVLAIRVTGCGVVTLTAVACCAIVIAIAALAAVITSAPLPIIAASATLVSVGLLQVSARTSIALAGLSPKLPAAACEDAQPSPKAELLAARAMRADSWLTSLHAAFSWSAGLGASVAAVTSQRGVALAALTAMVLLLRARSTPERRRRTMYVIGGTSTAAVTFAITALGFSLHEVWTATLTAVLAAAAMYLGFVAPAVGLSPIAQRSIDALELTALAAMAPLVCWISGVFSAVRGLDL